VKRDLEEFGHVLHSDKMGKSRKHGPVTMTLDEVNSFILLILYLEELCQATKSYTEWLQFVTGTTVSKSTVSRVINHGFPICGGFRKPNMVPFDKFCPRMRNF
jgi:hypothetical protein